MKLWVIPFLILLISCTKRIDTVRSGSYEYSFTQQTLTPANSWSLLITPLKKDSVSHPPIKYYPSDYYKILSVGQIRDKHYACIPVKDGLLEISGRDSIRFLNRYNSSLASLGPIHQMVEQDKSIWINTSYQLYRLYQNDTIVYQLGPQGTYPIRSISPASSGIWAQVSGDLFLIREKAAIKIELPENILRWVALSNSQMQGYSATGVYTVSEQAVSFKKKAISSWFPKTLQETKGNWTISSFSYQNELYLIDPIIKKIYLFTEQADYQADFNAAQYTGISPDNALWTIGYNHKAYWLQVSAPGWQNCIKNNTLQAQPKAVLPGYNEFTGSSFLRNNGEPVVVSAQDGTFFYRQGKLHTAKEANLTTMNSFLELESLPQEVYLKKVPHTLWSPYLLNKPIVADNGIQFNLYSTQVDSKGVSWQVDNGKLTSGSPPYQTYTIAEELAKRGLILAEPLESFSLLISYRVYINKQDIIHIFGKHTLILFNPGKNDWKVYPIPVSSSAEIHYGRIFEDTQGWLWFEVSEKGIYCFDGKTLQLMVPLSKVDFWQIDSGRQLTMIKDKLIVLMDLSDAIAEFSPVLATFPIQERIYGLGSVSGVVWRGKKPVIINHDGFYFYQ